MFKLVFSAKAYFKVAVRSVKFGEAIVSLLFPTIMYYLNDETTYQLPILKYYLLSLMMKLLTIVESCFKPQLLL